MSLFADYEGGAAWDDVTFQLSRWLARHLNNPDLFLWLARRGGQLHPRFAQLIEVELERVADQEPEGMTAELEPRWAEASEVMPSAEMRKLWRLMLSGRIGSSAHNSGLYRLREWLQREGPTTTLRLKLRESLAPKIAIRKPLLRGDDVPGRAKPTQSLTDFFDYELVLASDHVHHLLEDIKRSENWGRALISLHDDAQQLLRDALDLMQELGKANDRHDPSFWDLPSITRHWQNRHHRDWVALIELVRDSWLAIREVDLERASRIAQDWFRIPYLTFKRLALFAASHTGSISPGQWVEWLTGDGACWLWAAQTKREVMRLLVLQGKSLTPKIRQVLEDAILAGPPRDRFRDDLTPQEWEFAVDHAIWLRMAKLHQSGCGLGKTACKKFDELTKAHPAWRLMDHEQEEFAFWMSGTGDPDFEESRQVNIAPPKRKDLVDWLKQVQPSKSPWNEDTWRETCATHFANAGAALSDLANEGLWPTERWKTALYAWSDNGLIAKRTWHCFAPIVQLMPNDEFKEVVHALTWWLRQVSEAIDPGEEMFMDLCRRALSLPYEMEQGEGDPVFLAINHPVGHVATALINLWLRRKPNDNEGLLADVEPLFRQLCDTQVEHFRHGRVLLASHLVALFRVDQSWTQAHLLPALDWTRSPTEAQAVWGGFLFSPRLYEPLLGAVKDAFLATGRHYDQLGELRQRFATFLTYAALMLPYGYSTMDFQAAIAELPEEGLVQVARTLVQALEAAGDRREEYWENRIHPFWSHIWPKSNCLASSSLAEPLALLAIASRGKFPAALSVVIHWLSPIEHPHLILRQLCELSLPERFPEDVLSLLDVVLSDQSWAPGCLGECLNAISQASPGLSKDRRFTRLAQYARRHGGLG